MFSEKNMVCLAFGEENDTYYTDDLLVLNLHQYLWMQLHREGYKQVYFLRSTGNAFEIRTFGDVGRQLPKNGVFFWKENTNILSTQKFWEQLKTWTEQGAAVVCPLRDFCQVMEKETAPDRGREEMSRKGLFVLTASVYAEQNAANLLTSCAFSMQKLNFRPLLEAREATEQGLYELLKGRNCCVFLNTPTPERIRAILQRILMENPKYMMDCPDLDAMADILAQYLQDTALQTQPELRALKELPHNPLFHTIYNKLKEQNQWNALFRYSQKSRHRQEFVQDGMILRQPDGYAARCLLLQMPQNTETDSTLYNCAEKGLEQIRTLAASPRNKLENPLVAEKISYFLGEVTKARNSHNENSECWIIYSISVCISRICAEKNGDTEKALIKVVEILRSVYELMVRLFEEERELRKNVTLMESYQTREEFPTVYAIQDVQLKNLQTTVAVTRSTLERCMQLAYGAALNLANRDYQQLPETLQRIQDMEQELAKPLQALDKEQVEKQPNESETVVAEQTHGMENEKTESEYEIRTEDLVFRIP